MACMYPLLAVILALLLFGCADVQERSRIEWTDGDSFRVRLPDGRF